MKPLTPAERRRRQWRTASRYEHYADCYLNEDDCEAVNCSTCGRPWVRSAVAFPDCDRLQWYCLLAALDRGERVVVSRSAYQYLCEARPSVGATPSGLVLALDGFLVQVTTEGGHATAQAVGVSLLLAPGHEHQVDCTILSDGWELVYCRACGAEW